MGASAVAERATFHSRYPNYLVTLPTLKGCQFLAGEYTTDDPYEIAILRDVARAEARSNRAIWETDAPGAVRPFGGYEPPPPTFRAEPVPSTRPTRGKRS